MRIRWTMPAIAAVLLVFALSGCATLADKVGIATKKYVDQRAAGAAEQAATAAAGVAEQAAAETAATRKQLETQIIELRKELLAAQKDAEAARIALAEIERVASAARIEQLAKAFEDQLTMLPDETLRRLVGILTEYLGQGKQATPDGP